MVNVIRPLRIWRPSSILIRNRPISQEGGKLGIPLLLWVPMKWAVTTLYVVVYGTRVSLTVGVFAAIIVLIIGVLYGSIFGYFGGKTDLIMMRIIDIIYSPSRYADGEYCLQSYSVRC